MSVGTRATLIVGIAARAHRAGSISMIISSREQPSLWLVPLFNHTA